MNINTLLFHSILHLIIKIIYVRYINYYNNIKLHNSECILYCEDLYKEFRIYYSTKSEWAYIYGMLAKKYNKVDQNKCDILYHYKPFSNNRLNKKDTGYDKRRFILQNNNKCEWSIIYMGKKNSGTSLEYNE